MAVPIERLRAGASLRLGPMKTEHLDLLVQFGGGWPPVLITRRGRIIDGNYRYAAARRLGWTHLDCVVFHGSDDEAFVEALRRNTSHGLALTLEERRTAATRVLAGHPHWSDRRIAAACGLAHETVGRLRVRLSRGGEIRHLDRRLGRDGRYQTVSRRTSHTQPDEVVPVPTTDDAFVSTDDGRSFVGWFERNTIDDDWRHHVGAVPLSRIYEIADESRRRAAAWNDFANALTTRVSDRTAGRPRS
jgi:hypothetical protein